MTYYDLYGLCEKYGVHCDYDIHGEGAGSYRIYCWDNNVVSGLWPIRALATLTLSRLQEMTRAELEDFVVSAAVMSAWT
jgi:hypothetical protein